MATGFLGCKSKKIIKEMTKVLSKFTNAPKVPNLMGGRRVFERAFKQEPIVRGNMNVRKGIYLGAYILAVSCIGPTRASAQKRVLFIGNSYTYFQEMPRAFARLAEATGEDVTYEMIALGGYTLKNHWQTPSTVAKVASGDWDYIVLQEQSQLPSFPLPTVEEEVFPYARKFDSLSRQANPCTQTVFFMTWGRKNGDSDNCPHWTPVCTYRGMDSLLQLRYTMMAESNKALLAPVAPMWNKIRAERPGMELYQSDESHPSATGTYVSAVCFYTLLYGKDPRDNSYDFTLTPGDADYIKGVAKSVVLDSMGHWLRYSDREPRFAGWDVRQNGTEVSAGILQPENVTDYSWDFGDGSAPVLSAQATHVYAAPGTYRIALELAGNCGPRFYYKDIEVTRGTSVEDLRGDAPQVVALPSPARERAMVQGLEGDASYKLIDVWGSVRAQGHWGARTEKTIDLAGLPAGTYLLHWSSVSGSGVIKVAKY